MQLRIKAQLFLSFTLLSSILVASSSYLFYTQSSKDLMKRVEETNQQQLYRYQELLDNMIEDIDRISAQVIYNSDLKNYLSEQRQEEASPFQSFTKRKKIEDLLASFNGPWFIARQINIITTDGFFLTYGQNLSIPSDVRSRIQGADWLNDALRLHSEKLLVPPHISEWQDEEQLTFSLVRSFNFPLSQAPAVVEIQQPYNLLPETLDIGSNTETHTKIYVINDNGAIYYPSFASSKERPLIPRYSENVKEIKSDSSGDKEVWTQLRSDYSGLTVLMQQPRSVIMQPIAQLQKITWILALLGEIASLFIAYMLSAGIASPIRYLQKRLEKFMIDSIHVAPVKKLWNTKEIAMLYDTYEEMRNRLNHSVNEMLQAQKRENYTHLQAMYAQINPHFLYNTLASMASYAEESGFPGYASLSQKLSQLLRYSTGKMSSTVTLEQEIHHTVQYMELMQFRYEGQFSFTFSLDRELEEETVPKFLLQPLVENSFSHGFRLARPPWTIKITATMSDDRSSWQILISDNGSGFSEDAFRETQTLILELNQGEIRELKSLSTRGLAHMGIVNTLTRCRLFWNEHVTFALESGVNGMTFIIAIGRPG